jgi:hypothetical protein
MPAGAETHVEHFVTLSISRSSGSRRPQSHNRRQYSSNISDVRRCLAISPSRSDIGCTPCYVDQQRTRSALDRHQARTEPRHCECNGEANGYGRPMRCCQPQLFTLGQAGSESRWLRVLTVLGWFSP